MNSEMPNFLPTFLLGFSSLFPLINPIGTAFISGVLHRYPDGVHRYYGLNQGRDLKTSDWSD
jgi:hypothetical protein